MDHVYRKQVDEDGGTSFRAITYGEPATMFHVYIGELRGWLIKFTSDRDALSPELIRFDERVFATEKDMLDCANAYRNRGYKVCVDTGSIFQDYR